MNVPRASPFFWSVIIPLGLAACGAPPAVEKPRHVAAPAVSVPAHDASAALPPRLDDRFAVAAENESAVEVARAILEQGGSAADASVAAVLVGCAAHAASCGLGGGGEAIMWDAAAKEATTVDFRETAPRGIKRVDYLTRNPAKAKRGLLIGVPGLVAGLFEIHRRAGKLPWATVVTAAAERVDKGIPLSPYMAQALVWNAKWLGEDESARMLGPTDAGSRVGERVPNAALGTTLHALAEGGQRAFYSGPIADELVASARAVGSRISQSDLTSYKVVVSAPLRATWDRFEVLSAPPSSGGGITTLQLLAMFDRADLGALEWGTSPYVHALAEGFRAANQDRALNVGDPAFTRTDAAGLFDGQKMRARRAKIRMDATTMPKIPSISESGTFHVVVVDAAGGIVSVTASISSMFGSKVVSKGGYVLNDALAEFNIDDYGIRVVSKGPNFARGGARPVSSLVPTLVLEGGAPVLALGASGGLRAPTALTQVLFAVLGFGRPLAEAVEAPRFHVASSGALKLDEGLASLAPDLIARGEVVDAKTPNFGAVTAIALRREAGTRVLEPVFDPRKGGAITTGHGEQPVVTKPVAPP